MNEQHIEDMITVLYDMVQDARSVPLSTEKCILERDKVLDMLDEILAQLPAELKQSRTIVESRNELIGQARRESEAIVRQAQEHAKELVAKEAVYQEAQKKSQEMMVRAQLQVAEVRKASNDYMDDALRRTEESISQSLEDVRDIRTKFRALVEAQERRASTVDTEL